MSRPKKEFVPTNISDFDSISLGSNGDRHNNNSNGARFHNLNRSKATSSFNLASQQKSFETSSNNNFSRTSKQYGSTANLSGHQSVNNYSLNSPTSAGVDRWEQAWEDNSNAYRPPSYQQQQTQQREHSFEKSNSIKHSHTFNDFKRTNSISLNQPTSNRSSNIYVADPFDDPWSGISISLFLLPMHNAMHTRK